MCKTFVVKLGKQQDFIISRKPGRRAAHSSKTAASESHSSKATEAGANTSPSLQLTPEDLKGMFDNIKDEILSEFHCTVATLQSTASSQEVEEGLNVDGGVDALECSYTDLKAE